MTAKKAGVVRAQIAVEQAVKLSPIFYPTLYGESPQEEKITKVAQATAERIIYQDPPHTSKRLWASSASLLTVILMAPEVQAELYKLLPMWIPAEYMPMAMALIAAGLSWWSKQQDVRPIKEGPA